MTVPLYALTDTWNDAGVAFAAIRMNAQDSGHAAGSLLLDLQMNGVSQFTVDPTGALTILGDVKFIRDASLAPGAQPGSTLALRNGNAPQTLRVYNKYTDDNNFERAFFGWIAAPNVLGLGNVGVGSGVTRPVQFIGANFLLSRYNAAGPTYTDMDCGIFRAAPGVVEVNSGQAGNRAGAYFKWGGTARVVADFSITSNATLQNIGGLTVNVAAGRAYAFEAELSFTCNPIAGIKCAIGGAATATNIIYDGWIVDGGAAGIKGNVQATALGGVVAAAPTTTTTAHVTIRGTIEVNAGGSLTVEAAQNTADATATVIKRGSRLIVHDIT